MSSAEVSERSAAALVGQFVRWRPRDSDNVAPSLGFFSELAEEDAHSGWVFDYATKEYVMVTASWCVGVPRQKLCGLKNVPVMVDVFGEGEIYSDYYRGKILMVRVRNDRDLMTTVSFSQVSLLPPPPRPRQR